jgi:hypothetical protein
VAAERSGFKVTSQPTISRSRSVVLERR